jgi:hypothetical protein
MPGNIIERAFEIAPECGSLDEVGQRLGREGFMNVSGHLSGKLTRRQINDRLHPELKRTRHAPPSERNGG